MQIKYPGGDFGPLGRRNQPSLVLWLIFVEWDIDLGSTFCKYLPNGPNGGPEHRSGKKTAAVSVESWAHARVWVPLQLRNPSLQPIKLMMG